MIGLKFKLKNNYKMELKESLIVETKKLLSILNTYGNVLVPSVQGQNETFAQDKLIYVVNRLESEFNLSLEEIQREIEIL